MIKDLQIGNAISNMILYCSNKTQGVSVKGDTYYSLTLQDATGVIPAKIWDISNIPEFAAKSFIAVTGSVTSFKDAPQLNISAIELVDPNTVNLDDFCPKTPNDIDQMANELNAIIDSISNEWLKKLLDCFFKNDRFLAKFLTNSAAKTVHHAYVGGLLEHTLAVTKICVTLADNYPAINRDLLLTAAICHDIGKIKEISSFPDNDYTDEGNLLGHIYMGAEMIDVQARKIDGFPRQLLNELKHCILAHHGAMEYGSPKVPALIEATALSFADDTDAKLRRFSDLLADNDGTWTEKSDFFLGSKYRKTLI